MAALTNESAGGDPDFEGKVQNVSGEGLHCLFRCLVLVLAMVGLSGDVTSVRNENHPDSVVNPASLNKETFQQGILSEFILTVKTYCARLRCMIPGLTFM